MINKFHLYLFILFVSTFYINSEALGQSTEDFNVDFPKVIVQNIPGEIEISIPQLESIHEDTLQVSINGKVKEMVFENGKANLEYEFSEKEELTISIGSNVFSKEVTPIPLWMSILPPLIAIIIALIFREVFSALFIGLMVGSVIITYYQGVVFWKAIFPGDFCYH